MQIKANSPEEYIAQLPEDRKQAITELRKQILENIPKGFEEQMNYGMIGYVIPHSLYPKGYHVDSKQPLPFLNIASQKNHVAVYHSGIYSDPKLMDWFVEAYKKQCKLKLDIGKSCIRFKKIDQIPYTLFGELAGKVSSQEWIDLYESKLKK